MKNSFTVLIPTRNELKNLRSLGPYLELFQEVIFVDGNSSDGTVDEISSLYPSAKVITQGSHKGKGSAVLIGLKESSGDYAVVLDADTPVSLSEVKSLMAFCNRHSHYDLIKSSRHLKLGGSDDLTFVRSIGAKFFAFLTRILYRVKWTEMCYGFWAIRLNSFRKLNLDDILRNQSKLFPFNKLSYGQSFEFDQVIFLRALKSGFSIHEIPSYEISRKNGRSNLFAPVDGLKTLLVIFREFFSRD